MTTASTPPAKRLYRVTLTRRRTIHASTTGSTGGPQEGLPGRLTHRPAPWNGDEDRRPGFSSGCRIGLRRRLPPAHAAHLRRNHWKSGSRFRSPVFGPGGEFLGDVPRRRGGTGATVFASDRSPGRPAPALDAGTPEFRTAWPARHLEDERGSRTSVAATRGGAATGRPVQVSDKRAFRNSARCSGRGLEPVFKNWDSVFLDASVRGMDDAFGLYLVMTDPVVGYEACATRRSMRREYLQPG